MLLSTALTVIYLEPGRRAVNITMAFIIHCVTIGLYFNQLCIHVSPFSGTLWTLRNVSTKIRTDTFRIEVWSNEC